VGLLLGLLADGNAVIGFALEGILFFPWDVAFLCFFDGGRRFFGPDDFKFWLFPGETERFPRDMERFGFVAVGVAALCTKLRDMECFGFFPVGAAALCNKLRDMERFGFVPMGVPALCTESNLEEVDFLDVDLAWVQYGDELQLADLDGKFEAVVDLVGDIATATPSRTITESPLRQQPGYQ
jgi:hypothetical protein